VIKIIDNLITPRYADAIERDMVDTLQYSYLRHTSTDLKYGEYLGELYSDNNVMDCGQFSSPIFDAEVNHCHPFYFEYIKPLIYSLEDKVPEFSITGICRIKSNILTKQNLPDTHYNIPHHDGSDKCYSMIYYTQDSDGDTFLFNEFFTMGEPHPNKLTVNQRIKPKKNRAVIFQSNRYHASSNPVIHKDRIILNFVFEAYANN
jgi:hypothetical protein